MLEVLKYPIPNSVNKAVPLRGQFLSRSPSSRHEKAFRGADLYCGRAQLVAPTLVQAAFVSCSTVSSVWWAVQREAYREEIIAEVLPLVPPRTRPAPTPTDIDDAELIAIARQVGVDRFINAAAMVEAAQ